MRLEILVALCNVWLKPLSELSMGGAVSVHETHSHLNPIVLLAEPPPACLCGLD